METKVLGPIGPGTRSVIRNRTSTRWLFRWNVASIGLAGAMVVNAQPQFESLGLGRGGLGTGEQPFARVIEGPDGALYGVTRAGGSGGGGTVYTLEKDGRGFRVLHYFGPQPDGLGPTYGGLTFGTNGLIY